MNFHLIFTREAANDLVELKKDKSMYKRYKAVCKALALLERDQKHPSLQTHKYYSIKGQNNEEIFEAYAENNTPAAYRIFWHYGPKRENITILAITSHP
jgi:hypothetical protein